MVQFLVSVLSWSVRSPFVGFVSVINLLTFFTKSMFDSFDILYFFEIWVDPETVFFFGFSAFLVILPHNYQYILRVFEQSPEEQKGSREV